ncbi:MAG: hypothetical protein R2784_10395 [Saprospiraceae bacterium]
MVVSPPYPVNLEEALKLNRQTIITITNLSNGAKQIKLLATVEGDNGILGKDTTWFCTNFTYHFTTQRNQEPKWLTIEKYQFKSHRK